MELLKIGLGACKIISTGNSIRWVSSWFYILWWLQYWQYQLREIRKLKNSEVLNTKVT